MKEWNDWLWVKTAVLTWFPGTLLVLYKIILDVAGKPPHLKRWSRPADLFFRVIFGYCFVYYILDSVSIVLLNRLHRVCYSMFFAHHIFSALGLRLVFSFNKPVFWYEILVGTMHSFVLSFPKYSFIQYGYVTSFFILCVFIFLPPYNNYSESIRLRKYLPPVLLSFTGMHYFSCLNMLDAVNVDRSGH